MLGMLKCLQNPVEIITLSLCEMLFECVCSLILYYIPITYNAFIKKGFKLTQFVKFHQVVIVAKQISSYYNNIRLFFSSFKCYI